MLRFLTLLFATVAVVHCRLLIPNLTNEKKRQDSKTTCEYKYDQNSPFFWTGAENICTEELCQTYPDMDCYPPRAYIMSNVYQHKGENITQEVAFLQKYFDTFIPKTSFSNSDYRCAGVCAKEPKLVERVFHDVEYTDSYSGALVKSRVLCHVVGPKIYRTMCKGRCRIRIGGQDSFCVPDVTVSMDVWVFCPDADPSCRKIRLDIPLSCSCKKIQCFKPPPALDPFEARLPDSVNPFFDPLFGPPTGPTEPTPPTGPTPPLGPTPPTPGTIALGKGIPSQQNPQTFPLWKK